MLIDFPHALNIFLTSRCNLSCRYCFINKDNPPDKELETPLLKKGCRLFLKLPIQNKQINFSGGEPLLEFENIKKICLDIRKNTQPNTGVSISIATNGTLFTDNVLYFLKNNKVDIKISIDGKQKVHDANRPFKNKCSNSSYNYILKNLPGLMRYNLKPSATLVFTPLSYKSLLGNIRHLQKLGFSHINFFPSVFAEWKKNDLKNLEIIFKEFVNFYIDSFVKKEKIFKNSTLDNFVKERELYKPLLCQQIHLDWEGNFYCCDRIFFVPESKRKKFLVGNINKGIDNILRIKLLSKLRKEMASLVGRDCRACKYAKYCFCPVGNYIYFSSYGLNFKEYFPQFCRLSQIYIKSFFEIKKNLQGDPLFSRIYSSN